MQLSDVTQHERRVRALLDGDDLRLIIARHVAAAAGVHLTDPRIRVSLIEIRTVGSPGPGPRAEVILHVDQADPLGQRTPNQTEQQALKGAKT